LARNKALVIEDTKTFRAILAEIFSHTDIDVDFVDKSSEALDCLTSADTPYNLIVASSTALKDEPEYLALSLRTEKYYAHTPLVLLTNHNSEADRSYYAVGFTQIYTRAEIGKFKDYIDQFLSRGAFSKKNDNKVVIIEDDLPQQLVLKAILESNYCECYCFTSAEEALTCMEKVSPDAIVVDFFLEGKMTGMEFINEVRRLEHPWQRIPILATTALDDPARKYEFLRAGANDYLVKPMETIDLTVRVENLIKYKRLLDTVEQQRAEMQYLAMHDQLTGLYNRHYMATQVSKRIREAKRHKISFSIVVLDVDHFKNVNDTHGHAKGDAVLKAVAEILKDHCRSEDIVARIGGEEFILFLGYCDLNNAVRKASKLRESIEKSLPAGLPLTASFGVAQITEEYDNFDSLFKAADEAVYRAKNSGRNRVESA